MINFSHLGLRASSSRHVVAFPGRLGVERASFSVCVISCRDLIADPLSCVALQGTSLDGASAGMSGDQFHDFHDEHASLGCRRTQMGILGVLNLVGSSSLPARSLAAWLVPDVCGRRSAISPSSSPPPSPSPTGRGPSVFSCSSSSCCNDDPLADGHCDDSASDQSNAAPPPSGRRRGRRPRRTVGRARTETEAERQGVLTGLNSSALRRLLGERTRADASVGTGMIAKVISAPDAMSRFLFCVVGPHFVDLATIWYSPDGQPLCSCWGHTQNVAFLSMTGDTSTCRHAKSFQAAVDNLASYLTDIMIFLQVRGGTRPYGTDVKTHTGMAAAAFDGSIFSPVVATRRRDVKCVAVSCRANPRRCHHATLVRALGRLAVTTEVDDDVSDIM